MTFGSAGNTGVVAIAATGVTSISNPTSFEVAFGTLRALNSNFGFFTGAAGLFTTLTVDAGATLDVNDHSFAVNNLLGSGFVTLGLNVATTLTLKSGAFSGVISGAGGVTATGSSGNTTLGGINIYTGGTAVTGGTLLAGSTQAFGVNSATTVTAPGTLDIGVFDVSIGSLAGTGAVKVNANRLTTGGDHTTTTFSGAITGTTGGVTKEGTGTWTLDGAGSNTFTGAFTVNDGTVKLNMGGTAVPGPLNIGDGVGAADSAVVQLLQGTEISSTSAVTIHSDGKLDVNNFPVTIGSLAGASGSSVAMGAGSLFTGGDNTSTTFAGAIRGAGSLTKDGTGTFTLTGMNTQTGGTTLNAGMLAAGSSGALGLGNLTLNGGTLRNAGTPVSVNIGAGAIAFNGGTYQAQVGGTTPGVTHDQLRTTGTAMISGGRLALVQANGFKLSPGDKVNLLLAGSVAGGSANGTPIPAGSVTGLEAFGSPLLIPVVNAYLTSVTLEAMQGSFAALNGQTFQGVLLNFTPNQLAVAGALDSVSANNLSKTGVVNEFNFLDTHLSTLQSNLDKIAPEELTSIFNVSVAIANVSNLNLQRRMEDIRIQSLGGGGIQSAPADNQTRFADGPQGPVGRRSKEITPPSKERWGMFVIGAGEFTHIGSTTNASGYNLQTGGVTAGLDYRVTDNLAIGLNLGYANTTASLVNGGSLGVDGGTFGLYATWFDQNFYVDAAVSGGINSYKTRRVTPNNTLATGSPNGAEFNALFAVGYDWKSGALTFGPTASFQYTNTSLDSFTEAGAFAPLTIQGKSSESIRTNIGMRAYYEGKIGSVGFRPELRLGWQHEAGATGNNLTSNFATLGGRPFTVAGTTVGRDSLTVGAGFTILWNDRFATYVNYDGNIGAKNQESHNVSAGVRLQF